MGRRFYTLFFAILLGTFLAGCSDHPEQTVSQPSNRSITILWADWAPAELFRTLCEDFTKQTGIKIVLETLPFDTWQQATFHELERHGTKYDLVIGDSQWIGKGAVEGHYIDLTKWLRDHGITNHMSEASLSGYAEYPKGSMKYWAVPLQADAIGIAYRKDKFEDPQEQEAFLNKYGYPLTIPSTWEQLGDIAEFFYRPDEALYGIGISTDIHYDGITMGFQNLLFAWGGEWGNAQYKVKEFLNTPEAVEALTFYRKLYKLGPPNWENAFWEDINQAMIEGKIVMATNYFSFFPELSDVTQNPFAKDIGFFSMPKGPGQLRASALGGMGISLISYSKKKEMSLFFLDWLFREKTQTKWAQLGGLSCHKNILSSEAFLNERPFNTAFMETVNLVKDFWVVPQYDDLLLISQKNLHDFVVNEKYSAEETLDRMATEMEAVFESAGYYKE